MRRGWRAMSIGLALAAALIGGQTAAVAQEASPSASPAATPAASCADATRDTMAKVAHIWHEDVFAAKDPTLLTPYLSPDIVRYSVIYPDATGPAAVEHVLSNILTGFPDAQGTVEFVVVDAPYV